MNLTIDASKFDEDGWLLSLATTATGDYYSRGEVVVTRNGDEWEEVDFA